MANSQNGWPVLQANSRRLHDWQVPIQGRNRTFKLRNGSAGFILAVLALWYHENIQKLNIKGDKWDEWAYAYREIRGSSTTSNHASGTAEDLNATRYPLGRTVMKAWRKAKIRRKMRVWNHVVRWGGDYEGRKDQMHFEINKSLERCEKLARKLMKTKLGKRILDANPHQRHVILS